MTLKTCCYHDRNDNNNEITVKCISYLYINFTFHFLSHLKAEICFPPLSPLPSPTTTSHLFPESGWIL